MNHKQSKFFVFFFSKKKALSFLKKRNKKLLHIWMRDYD